MKDTVIPYFDTLYAKLEYNFNAALDTADTDGFHELRVSIKKMRALFSFVKHIHPRFKERQNFKNFRALFKAAAGVLDVQVQIEVLEKFEKILRKKIPEYKEYLHRIEQKEIQSFNVFGEKFAIKELKKRGRNIRNAIKDISLYEGLAFAENRFDTLIRELIGLKSERTHPEDELHTIRIVSKELRYTLEITEICLPELNSRQEIVNELKELHKYLGDWHDDVIALEYVNRFLRSARVGKWNEAAHGKLLEAIEDDKRMLVEKFEIQWDGFINKISEEELTE